MVKSILAKVPTISYSLVFILAFILIFSLSGNKAFASSPTWGKAYSDQIDYFYVGAGYGYADYYLDLEENEAYTYREETYQHQVTLGWKSGAPYAIDLRWVNSYYEINSGSFLGGFNQYNGDHSPFWSILMPYYPNSTCLGDESNYYSDPYSAIKLESRINMYVYKSSSWVYVNHTTYTNTLE